MARKSLMMKKMAESKPVVDDSADDLSIELYLMLGEKSWNELRIFAKSKGVAVFGRGRAVIERDLVEVLRG